MNLKIIALLCSFLLLFPATNALTPEEFNQRVDNFIKIRETYYRMAHQTIPGEEPSPTVVPPLEDIGILADSMKISYADAYIAKENRNTQAEQLNFNKLMSLFDLFQAKFPETISLDGLKDKIYEEFGKTEPTPQPTVRRVSVAESAESTVQVVDKRPSPTSKLVPTIPPEQLRGRKNFIYALADIIWENILLIGVFLIGILIVYSLYAKQEEQSTL